MNYCSLLITFNEDENSNDKNLKFLEYLSTVHVNNERL